MEQRLSIITLGVRDLSVAKAFYEKLGWRASPASVDGQMAVFQLGGIALMLFGLKHLADDANSKGRLPELGDFGGIAIAHNARSKEQVDAVLEQAVAAGATLLKPAEDVFWGGYSGYFADPDGHPWEVAWNPHWDLDDTGALTLPN